MMRREAAGDDRYPPLRVAGVVPVSQAPDPSATTAGNRLYVFGLGAALALGVCLRLLLIAGANFPVGDGGMFYRMVQDLLAHHLVPPLHTGFNRENIPFAYPFFGFYVVALLHMATGAGILTLMLWVPAVVCCLSLGAFALLARALLPSRVAHVAAIAAFGLLPDSFGQEIKGGGITRAWGELFCLLTLYFLVLLLRRGDRRYLAPAGLFAGLTVLAHLEWVWFLPYSAVVLWLFIAPVRARLFDGAAIAAMAAGVSAPWSVLVLHRYGAGTILATFTGSAQALAVSSFFSSLLSLNLVREEWLPIFTPLAIIGLLFCVRQRRWLLPAWLGAVWLVDWRAATGHAVIPVSLLAGVAVAALWKYLLEDKRASSGLIATGGVVLALVLLRTLFASWIYLSAMPPTLTQPERSAMRWAASHTAPGARFAVVSGADWSIDDNAEWFPALTARASVSTVQGTEWVPGLFLRLFNRNLQLQRCASSGSACLERWMRSTGTRIDYVYVVARPVDIYSRAGCCNALREALLHDQRYRLVFKSGGTTIFRRLAPHSSSISGQGPT